VDVTRIVDELRQERDQLDEAILSLERLAAGERRKGRPPAWFAAVKEQTVAGRPAVAKGRRRTARGPASESGEKG
jgi:hypothetical protein